jgi:XTP/dITP diphosphohydrolase
VSRLVVVATRSRHKLSEISQILSPAVGDHLVDLATFGLHPSEEEDDLERFDTFEENALAKARYFAARTGLPVMADDSGICVDALDGAPGVRSKRFAGRSDLDGLQLDQANNERLIDALRGHPDPSHRGAHYVCVIAIVTPQGREDVFRGTVDGRILAEPRGEGGFGSDPFFLPPLGATFAEVPQHVKDSISHRGRALAAALPRLLEIVQGPTSTAFPAVPG